MNGIKKQSVCTGCECVCEDLVVLQNGQLAPELNCELANDWFGSAAGDSTWAIDQATDFESKFESAMALLQNATDLVMTNLGSVSTEAQQAAVRLARKRNAFIDSRIDLGGRSGTLALQRHGLVTGTLGETRDRSDVVLFWFCDPAITHPRFMERFVSPTSTVLAIGTPFHGRADHHVDIAFEEASLAVTGLQSWLSKKLQRSDAASPTNILESKLAPAMTLIEKANHLSVIFREIETDSQFATVTPRLLRWTQEFNDLTRAISICLRSDANTQSFENVLAWTTGAPYAIRFQNGEPHHDTEYLSYRLVESGRCDTLLFAQPLSVPADLESSLKERTTVCLVVDQVEQEKAEQLNCDVILPIAKPGLSDSGSWCRLDDVSLPVSALRPSPLCSAAELLEKLLAV